MLLCLRVSGHCTQHPSMSGFLFHHGEELLIVHHVILSVDYLLMLITFLFIVKVMVFH